jgi:ring-1,2-phenylacetyl-CoA epoxidase subunit PaaE
MGIFSFKKKTNNSESKWNDLVVTDLQKISHDSCVITLGIEKDKKTVFNFIPGQYLTIEVDVQGTAHRRSYSICSSPSDELQIAVKKVAKGIVSTYVNTDLKIGDTIKSMVPEGNFGIKDEKKIVVFAAGSGITPIVSIAKSLSPSISMNLFYGNKTEEDILFLDTLTKLPNLEITHYLSREDHATFKKGRLDKATITEEIKANLSLLKADAFLLCGPENMIKEGIDTLSFFGVNPSKIKYELFTTPILLLKEEVKVEFNGDCMLRVTLDDETIDLTMGGDKKTILDAVENAGFDPPFSCRGGVCCSCKAKIIEGEATMRLNYSLTDEEVKDGYILTCQARPASEKLIITYD